MNYNPGVLIQLKETGAIYLIVEKCRIDFHYNAPRGLHAAGYDAHRSPDSESDYLKLVSPNGEIEYAMIILKGAVLMMEDWLWIPT